MFKRAKLFSTVLIITCAVILCLPALAQLKIGAGSAEITPDPTRIRVTTGGYGKFLGHVAKGIHDPVYAKAVVFEVNGKKAALAAIDLVEVSNEIMDAAVKRLQGTGFSRDNLFVCATHTHAAPGAVENIIIADLGFGPYSQTVVDIIADGIVKAIKDANASLKPANLGIAQGQAPGLTRNRRVDYYNYDTRRFARPYDPKTEPITDDTITIIRADDQTGKPIAIIFQLATHGTTLGPNNTQLSADWPGVTRGQIEAKYPGAIALFINGAQGDQAPDEADVPDDFQAMEIFGKRVADAAIPLVEKTKPVNPDPIKMEIKYHKVDQGLQAFGLKFPLWITRIWFKEMPFSGLRLGELIFLGAPVEAISIIGKDIRKSAAELGYQYPIYIGLMNDHYLYVTTPEEYRKGGYEADNTMFGETESRLLRANSRKSRRTSDKSRAKRKPALLSDTQGRRYESNGVVYRFPIFAFTLFFYRFSNTLIL